MKVLSVILAGGKGSRLWPVSRQSFPKQFLHLNTENSLLQDVSHRISQRIPFKNQTVITNQEYYDLVKMQVSDDVNILMENISKNTAPAILWAALKIRKEHGEDAIIFVSPSDHVIKSDRIFHDAVNKAIEISKSGKIVVFGIKPDYPETGFGYIKIAEDNIQMQNAYPVAEFKEKPDYDTAIEYYNSVNYFWNSGMFVFSAKTILGEFEKLVPSLYQLFANADPDNDKEIARIYEECDAISIDYAIMEKTNLAYIIPSDFGWNDLGNWTSFYSVKDKDIKGNVKIGNILDMDTENSLLYTNDKLLVTIGIDNAVVINTDDALVVSDIENIPKIGTALERVKASNERLLVENKTMVRPWGQYTVLSEGDNFKVKKLDINVNARLRLHMHHHRSEHWTVVHGTAKVTINDTVQYLHENESIYIPKSAKHRLENHGKIPLEIIEVQCGEYLGEDDTVSFD